MLYPLAFKPILKEKIWGGDALYRKFGMELPSTNIGESWSIAAHDNGMSVVSDGPLKGKTLDELIDIYGEKLLGTSLYKSYNQKFPLLIKIIDATDTLSVQVHPDDNYAAIYEDGELGKTEMWYIIDAKPGASLVYGIKPGTTREDFREAIRRGNLEKYLNMLEVKAGDVVYMPAGMVHAIGEGTLICEIQQNSDTTYRVYDWNRLGKDGRPRALHIDRALDVIDFERKYTKEKLNGISIDEDGSSRTYYIATEHFAIEKLDITKEISEATDGSKFYTLSIVDGNGQIEYRKSSVDFQSGQSILIPANLGNYTIKGECTLIKAYIPNIEGDILKPLLDGGYSKEELTKIVGI